MKSYLLKAPWVNCQINNSRRHHTQKIFLSLVEGEQKGILWALFLSGLGLKYSKVTIFAIMHAENVQPKKETWTFLFHSYRNSIRNKSNLTQKLCKSLEYDIRISYFTTFINAFQNMSNISLFLSFEHND